MSNRSSQASRADAAGIFAALTKARSVFGLGSCNQLQGTLLAVGVGQS